MADRAATPAYDPFNPPAGKGVDISTLATAVPTKVKESGLAYDPFTGPIPDASAEPEKKSTFLGSMARGAGGIISGTGRALEDIGLPTQGIKEYGQRLVDENPASVTDVSGALHDPGQFAKETAGAIAPQVGVGLGAAGIGSLIGGGLATLAGPEATPVGIAAGGALGAKVGQFVQDFTQQYGTIREGQDAKHIDDKLGALSAAAAGAAIDLLSPAEVVGRKAVTGGLKPVLDKSLMGTAQQVGLGVATGAGAMTAQTALQRAATYEPVTGDEANADYGIAALTGGVAGGAIHGVSHVLSPHGENLPANNQSDDSEQRALPAPAHQLALPAPEDRNAPGPDGQPVLRLPAPRSGRPSEVYGPAIAAIESRGSGGYDALGPVTAKGDRAIGRYQIMGRNVGDWTEEAGLGRMTPEEFAKDHAAQDIVFDHRFGSYIQKYGSPEEAARHWFGTGKSDILGTTPDRYVEKFRAAMGGAGDGAAGDDVAATSDTPDLIDLSPRGILARLRSEAQNPETGDPAPSSSLANRMAVAVANGDDDTIAAARDKITATHDRLISVSESATAEDVNATHHRLAEQERIVATAEKLARQIKERQAAAQDVAAPAPAAPEPTGPQLVTEPQPGLVHADTLPAGPQPQDPRLQNLHAQLALQEAHDAANVHAAPTMQDIVEGRAKSAAEKTMRAKGLARIIADKNEVNPRAAFQQHLQEVGLHPDVTAEEHGQLRAEESHRAREAVNEARAQAAEEQAKLAEQDTSLGVKERQPRPEPIAPEPVAAPEPAPSAEAVPVNIRTRADAHAETLGSSQREWFKRGVDAAMGDVDTPAPTQPSRATWFKQGHDFVTNERAAQEREHAAAAEAAKPPVETKPAPKKTRSTELKEKAAAKKTPVRKAAPAAAEKAKATSKAKEPAKPAPKKTVTAADVMKRRVEAKKAETARTERDSFLHDVDKEVGKTITAQQAQQLNIAEGAQENLGKESADKFSVKELRSMLQDAQDSRAKALGKSPQRSVGRTTERIRAVQSLRDAHARLRAELDRRGLHGVRLITSTLEALREHGEGTEGAFHDAEAGVRRTIEVAFDADDPLKTLDHELVHALRSMGVFKPHEWEALVKMAKGDKELMAWAEENYGHLDEADRMEEAVAEMFGDWAKTHRQQSDLPFFQRMMAKVKAYFDGLKNAFTKAGYKDAAAVMKDIDRGKISERFEGSHMEGAGETRQMYAGSKAKTADVVARERALDEHDRELGREKFGWHVDVDGKARFEIDDSRAKLNDAFTKLRPGETAKLGDLLDHPELYAAYPELKDTKVTRERGNRRSIRGWYNPETDTLNVAPQVNARSAMGIMLHELQHKVQAIEGFGEGASSETMNLANADSRQALRYYYERMTDIEKAGGPLKSIGMKLDGTSAKGPLKILNALEDKPGALEAMRTYQSAKQAAWEFGRHLDDMDEAREAGRPVAQETYNAWQKDYDKAVETRDRLKEDLRRKIGDPDVLAYDMYRLVSGEVEARDTEHRRALSQDMRRVTPPGLIEGIRPEEKIAQRPGNRSVLDEAPSGAPNIKYSKARSRPEDKVRRGVLDRSARNVKVTTDHLLRQGHVLLATTKDLARIVARHMPSAQAMVDLHASSHATARQFQERLVTIKEAYQRLPAKLRTTGPGSVNDFLYDSTRTGKWGFKPDYQPKAVVDAKMAERFNALPKAAQDVIKDVFQHNYDSRNSLYRATVGVINTEYDPQIAAAKTPADRATLEKQKSRALAHFSRVFDTQDGLPYTPLKREGNWAVTGMSREYLAARKAGDQETMDRLRSHEDHYFVDFRDTVGEADALQTDVAKKFKGGAAYAFPRDQVSEGAIGGKELYVAFDRLRQAIQGDAGTGTKMAQRLHRLATDLYLHSLSETSARKGEMARENVPGRSPDGQVLDMMKAFVSRGNATANYVASMANNPRMQAALNGMRKEVSDITSNSERMHVQRIHNEIMARYVNNLGWQSNRMVDKVVKGVTGWNLLSSPFYYLQNATQHVLISQPIMAGKFGYGRVAEETRRAYVDFAKATKDIKLTDRIDFTKFPADVRDAIDWLAKTGRLDAGYQTEFNSWDMANEGVFPAAMNKGAQFFRQMPQRVEIMNRAVTAMSSFRAALKDGMSRQEAMEYAGKLIDDSHGDYSGWNSPRPFNSDVGKVMLQFRKFQLIMGGLVGKQLHQAFWDGNATRAEKVQALKSLSFLTAHLAAIGGIMGLPGANLLGAVVGNIQNLMDPEKKHDFEEEMREALGAGGEGAKRNWWADFLYKGAPYSLLSMDTSDRLGMGNIVALAPYSDLPEALGSKEKMYEALGKFALGPSGGMLGKLVDGFGFGMEQHDWTRAAEAIAPTGISNAMKAYRFKTEGLTNKQGDVLLPPDEISGVDAFYTALGVRPRVLVNQAQRASTVYDTTEFYKGKTDQLTNQYAAAFKAKDAAKMQDLRDQWQKMNVARREQKLQPEPMSTLIKAPAKQMKTERQAIGGVATTKANRMYIADLMFSDNPQAARDLMAAEP